ncbi:hypothetical protein [Actinoplanes sp. NPDC051859]|uniref:hypothetical protein n=1 Tax=Actinoplanes sp. NPDC051859 TaxID=3363909 RepID=UPI0037A8AEFE
MTTLEELLDEGRHTLEVTPEELAEARSRRNQINDALRDAFPDSRSYINGSVAHGDANTPLTDVDQGVVVADAGDYGPGRQEATPLMEAAREAIRDHMAGDYEKLRVTIEGRKRSVLISFGDPVTPGQDDFTADVIVAIDNTDDAGLWIPNRDIDAGWDRSHPEKHTESVWDAIERTDKMFAKVIRLLKHWRDRHGKPLHSWNVKALALECIADEPYTLLEGLDRFFTHATDAIGEGFTEDPAGVSDPIKLPMSRKDVRWRLQVARDHITEAIAHEEAGRSALAQHELHLVLPGVVADSDAADLRREEVGRLRAGATLITTAAPTLTRGWAPR